MSFLLGRTFIVVTEPLGASAEWLQESVSCGIHDLQLRLQQPCSNEELLLCGRMVPASLVRVCVCVFFFIVIVHVCRNKIKIVE